MKTQILLLSLLLSSQVQAEVAPTRSPQAGLPYCIKDEATIQMIKTKMAANSGNSKKYDGYREALQSDTDEELKARLVYTETKAAKCPAQNSKIMPLIADAIANRITKKSGKVKEVVFQRNQFASSLNNYSESFYREFLCPTDAALWTAAIQQLHQPNKLHKDAVNYFLYQHHPDWTKEPWELPETEASLTSGVRSCIKVFENKDYK